MEKDQSKSSESIWAEQNPMRRNPDWCWPWVKLYMSMGSSSSNCGCWVEKYQNKCDPLDLIWRTVNATALDSKNKTAPFQAHDLSNWQTVDRNRKSTHSFHKSVDIRAALNRQNQCQLSTARIAQLGERTTEDRKVTCSIHVQGKLRLKDPNSMKNFTSSHCQIQPSWINFRNGK